MLRGMCDDSFDEFFCAQPVAAPKEYIDCPDHGDAKRQRVTEMLRFLHSISRDLYGFFRKSPEPESSRKGNKDNSAIIISYADQIAPSPGWSPRHCTFAMNYRIRLIS